MQKQIEFLKLQRSGAGLPMILSSDNKCARAVSWPNGTLPSDEVEYLFVAGAPTGRQ